MKKLLYFIIFLVCAYSQAQTTDPAFLTNIPNASQAEIDAYNVADLEEGMLVYNTDENRIFEYTNAGFQEFLLGPNIYVGHFIISSTGIQTITGIPFQPSQITFSAKANIESVTINDDNDANQDNNNGIANTFGSMDGYARNDGGTITQQVIFVGGNGASINDISRYAAANRCIGVRYANNNDGSLGLTSARVTQFRTDGFRVNVNSRVDDLLVLYTAYR